MTTIGSSRLAHTFREIQKSLSARHGLYLSCHAMLVILGLSLMLFDWQNTQLASIMVAVGASVLAMGFGGTVLFLLVWIEQKESERQDAIRRSGLHRIFSARSVRIKSEYDERLARATEAIDVLGFGLKALREDYRDAFAGWAQRADVRILIIDPDFPCEAHSIAAQRDREEIATDGAIADDVRQFIASCQQLIEERPARFRVRLYRCLPTINLFRIDHEVFWGPYLIGGVSRNMPTLLMEDGQLTERLKEHFDAIWTSDVFSRDIPDAWLQRESTANVR